ILLLTTKGARSGKARTVPLAATELDGRLVIAASMGGSARNPPWFYNIVANPDVIVEWKGQTFAARATVVDGPARDRLYAELAQFEPGFAKYQRQTTRVIPVIELIRT